MAKLEKLVPLLEPDVASQAKQQTSELVLVEGVCRTCGRSGKKVVQRFSSCKSTCAIMMCIKCLGLETEKPGTVMQSWKIERKLEKECFCCFNRLFDGVRPKPGVPENKPK